jgi:hypothetical protein
MKKESVLIVGCLSFILLVVYIAYLFAGKLEVADCGCPKMISQNFIGVFVMLAVIFVASLLYYLFSLKIDNKQKIIKSNIELLYSILDFEEKKVLKKLISNDGFISQMELSKSFGKLKSHRLIKKLEEKNIVFVKREGKKNKIFLKEELKQELVK